MNRLCNALVHGLVDQASFALLYYKVHKLSITLPISSRLFWYYAPSCFLSDLLVIAGFQILAGYACRAGSRTSGDSRQRRKQQRDRTASESETQGLLQDDIESASATIPPPPECEEKEGMPQADSVTSEKPLFTCFSILVKIWLVAISLLTSFVSFTSVTAYKTQHAIFTWQDAYNNLGSARVLKAIFDEFWQLFLVIAGIILVGGFCVTALRLVVTFLHHRYQSKISSRHILLIATPFALSYILFAILVRPPTQALQATNLLLDGLWFALATAFGVSAQTRPPLPHNLSNLNGTTLYGTSNMHSPRVTPINPIKHVFLIYLESGESLAWPYSPEFCQSRNCSDIAPEYDTPEYFTPFFNDLVNNDPNAVHLKGFRSNVAFTTKAQLASECGVLPEICDGVHNEATMKTSLPCLPDLLRAVDPRFKSSKFIAQDVSTDFYGDTAMQSGWDQMFGREMMENAWGETRPLSNWWGYSDEEVAPFWWDWIDERLKNDDRIFMSWSGATMHLPFALPPFTKPMQYTSGSQVSNGYLNTVRYTDEQLRLLFDGLRERGILDESLIILQGDHGPRIAPEGWTGIWGWFERIYQTPFVVRAPGLIADRIKQDIRKPFVSLDILPTIMDALGVDPAIIDHYPGQSVLRHRGPEAMRDTFHVQIPGNQYPHVMRYGKVQHLKARRTPDGDTCVSDIIRDKPEDFAYCAKAGWEGRVYVDQAGTSQWGTGVDAGLWTEGSEDELEVIAFSKEAETLLDEHLGINAAYWNSSNAEEYARSNSLVLEQIIVQAEVRNSLDSLISRFRM